MTEMPDAWTILKTNSTLDSGDAWEHLNNQSGESGPGGSLVLIDGLDLEVDMSAYDVEIMEAGFDVDVESDDVDIEIQNNQYEIEIDFGEIECQ
jgi:hypothetical protein